MTNFSIFESREMENINIVISGKCVDKFEDDGATGG